MKRYCLLFLFSILFVFQSCINGDDFDVKNNSRLLIKGLLVNTENNPISGQSVTATLSNEVIGASTSNDNGHFNFVSVDAIGPFTENDFKFLVEIGDRNPETLESTIRYFMAENESQLYDLGTVVLRDKAVLNFSVNKTTLGQSTIDWMLSYESGECHAYFANGTVQMSNELTDCYEKKSESLNQDENNPNFSKLYIVQAETEAVFTYRIDGREERTEIITINTDTVDYVFEF